MKTSARKMSLNRSSSPEAACPSCGAELVTHFEKLEQICGKLACRGPWLQRRINAQQERQKAEKAALRRAIRTQLEEHCDDIIQDDQTPLLMIVPEFDGELAPQSEDRKEAFRQELEERFAAAEPLAADLDRARMLRQEYQWRHEDELQPHVINACSTCRGSCCQSGKTHAYLQPEFLAFRLITEPEETSATLIDDYLRRIPERSMNDSCLYHTAEGCNLPREIRSSTCNEFLCEGIREHCVTTAKAPNTPTAAVAIDLQRAVRVGVMDAEGNRFERTIDHATKVSKQA